MSVTFSIVISQTASEALMLLKERQFLAKQQVVDLHRQLDALEEQGLEGSTAYGALMEQLEESTFEGHAFYELQMASANFHSLNALLALPTEEGDMGRISSEKLLLKIAQARHILRSPGGKEWERAEEPACVNGSFKIMATPGLTCADLENYLRQLQRIAEFAYANQADVNWS